MNLKHPNYCIARLVASRGEIKVRRLNLIPFFHIIYKNYFLIYIPCWVGSVGSLSASRTEGREFASRPGHTKDHHKMVQIASLHRHACVRVGVWQCSPTV